MPSAFRNILFAATGLFAMTSGQAAQADGVLVLGGTGQLGAHVVRLLLDDGQSVAVLARAGSDRSRLDGLDVTFVTGDLLNADEVMAAVTATKPRVIINTVRGPLPEADFYLNTTNNLLAAADANDVRQIIHHGAVGAGDNMALHPEVPWASVPGLEARMIDHGKAETLLLDSTIDAVIIRNSQVWPDRYPSTGHARLSEDQRTLTPITRADLAILTMQCLDNADCTGKIYHARDDSLVGQPRPAE